MIFLVVKLDLFIRALLLGRILALEKKYAYASRTSFSVRDGITTVSLVY